MNNAYTVTDKAVSVMINCEMYTVSSTDDRYKQVLEAIRADDFDRIATIMDVKGRLVSESNGGIYLMNGQLRCDEFEIPALLAQRIVESLHKNLPTNPMVNFITNLRENPNESGSIVEELWSFLEVCNLPITSDGCFLAYKMVNPDFTDIYTGKMDNSVGAVVEMNRADCDFNRGEFCSSGLHFCSEGYLGHYGTRSTSQVVVVKVNPRDVTSIPTDYKYAKGRACRYEIVDAISWEDRIKPYYDDQYDPEPVQPELDLGEGEGSAAEGRYRWEVRDSSTSELLDSFRTREQARTFLRETDGELYIWDTLNEEYAGGFSPDPADGESEETLWDIMQKLGMEPDCDDDDWEPVWDLSLIHI